MTGRTALPAAQEAEKKLEHFWPILVLTAYTLLTISTMSTVCAVSTLSTVRTVRSLVLS